MAEETGQKLAEGISSGVQELIDTLKDKGVSQGRKEGKEITDKAVKEAERLVREAKDEARGIISEAEKEAEFIKSSGTEALQMAYRNVMLDLKDDLMGRFAGQIKQLIGMQLRDEELLRKLILEVASTNSVADEEAVTVYLPEQIVGVDDLRQHPEKMAEGSLLEFVSQQASDLLSDGVTFAASPEMESGIRIQVEGKNVSVDLTEETLATLILAHVQPRFRALLEGVVG